MSKKIKMCSILCVVFLMVTCLAGCGKDVASPLPGNESGASNTENMSADTEKDKDSNSKDASVDPEGVDSEDTTQNGNMVTSDLKPSQGLEFESNGDGTCTIVGIGVCTDTAIVIPEQSPNGDTVTLIDEYAFMSLEDVESVTLLNYSYEVDERAFQYGGFTELYVIGGTPAIKESAFSSCEDLKVITFMDCAIQLDEYAFLSCGKDVAVSFTNCTGTIADRAFQYGDLVSLTISKSELEIGKSAFSSCEGLTVISFSDSTLTAEEYAFLSCGDAATVEMTNCDITLDDRAFQYGSLKSLVITGSKVKMGDSVFSSCEDLETVTIDCTSVSLGKYAFLSCEDLTSVSICDNASSENQIQMDDRAFQYCKRLEKVTVGNGTVAIGKYVFSGGADNLTITVAGNTYTAKQLENGLK